MAARQWTLAQRQLQAEKIRQWQPWQHSTGAKTLTGKAKSSRNAYKGGIKQILRKINVCLRDQSVLLKAIFK